MEPANGTERTGPVDKKVILSQLILFWAYITDLFFAVFVWAIFLLSVWGLHYCGDALGMTWFLFSWRIIELAVVSFGTFWCVLFFMNATVRFIQKLKLQEPIKKVQFSDIVIRFAKPLSKHNRPWFFSCCGIVFAVLVVGISFAETLQDDSDDLSIVGCEMLCETGPDFTQLVSSCNSLATLTSYSKYLEQKWIPGILRDLTYSPVKGFDTALQVIKDIDLDGSQERAASNIWRAGEEVMLSRLKAPKLSPRWVRLNEYRKVPKDLSEAIKNALKESKAASELFDEVPTLENAIHSCECNRKTMLLVFLARRARQNQFIDEFQEIVKSHYKNEIDVIGEIRKDYDDPRKEFLAVIVQSEQRRERILIDIKNRNIPEAIEHMWDAIGVASSRRDYLLKLSEKVRTSGNYSTPII